MEDHKEIIAENSSSQVFPSPKVPDEKALDSRKRFKKRQQKKTARAKWQQWLLDWCLQKSVKLYVLGPSCCAGEMESSCMIKDLHLATHWQEADILLIVGMINHKRLQQLVNIYQKMSQPKWVLYFAGCSCGHTYSSIYNYAQELPRYIPLALSLSEAQLVTEGLEDVLNKLMAQIQNRKI